MQCSWAQSEGQDFIANHQTSSIDYVTFHSWADNWFDDDLSFQTAWIQQHAADAASLGKPVRACGTLLTMACAVQHG